MVNDVSLAHGDDLEDHHFCVLVIEAALPGSHSVTEICHRTVSRQASST